MGETDGGRLAEKLQLVSHDVRAAILVELARLHQERDPDSVLGFADLRRRVGHDDPGNFNYHLKQLGGNLVVKTDGGYRLSHVGHHLVAVLVSDRFDPAVTKTFPDVETACLLCERAATTTYEDGSLQIACPDGHTITLNVGPELLERRSVEESLQIALRRTLLEARSVIDGTCPYCEGPTTGEFTASAASAPVPVQYSGYCERCGMTVQSTAGGCVLFHPAVVSFCHRYGRDIYRQAWTVMASNVEPARVTGEDPFRVEARIAVDTDRLVLTLDRSAAVLDTEHGSTDGQPSDPASRDKT
jgi:hypothetical protein